ncbi:MAG: hypothetical protein OHM56_03030 [Spiroplasma phoeniceum]|nr:MAG: hypothetical protein OHM56_03030 [Spiroplasma phoeniceum]
MNKFLRVNIFAIAKSYYKLLENGIQIQQLTKDYLDSSILFFKKQLNNYEIDKMPDTKKHIFYKSLKQEFPEIIELCIKLNYILFLYKYKSKNILRILNLQNENEITENSFILNETELLKLSFNKKHWYELILI